MILFRVVADVSFKFMLPDRSCHIEAAIVRILIRCSKPDYNPLKYQLVVLQLPFNK
jgi:hypothetical protein